MPINVSSKIDEVDERHRVVSQEGERVKGEGGRGIANAVATLSPTFFFSYFCGVSW